MNTMQIARLSFAVTLAIVANACNAAVAVAFSETGPSGNNWAVVTNEPNTAIAGQKAVAECAKKTGKKDCKVLLSSDKKGYGALYATCVTERQCFTSAITGFPTRNAAHDAVLADCKQYYGVQSCMPWGDWNDTGATTRAVAQAPAAQAAAPAPVAVAPSRASQSTLEVRCSNGDADACYNLGRKYLDGPDPSKAIDYMMKACMGSHHTDACETLCEAEIAAACKILKRR